VIKEKPKTKPSWIKNTYFWLAAILVIIGILGLIGGDALIRDPGQKKETSLWLLYFGAAIIMAINGLLSHNQTVRDYEEFGSGVGSPNTSGRSMSESSPMPITATNLSGSVTDSKSPASAEDKE